MDTDRAMKQSKRELTDNQQSAPRRDSLAARSARAAWKLLRQDEQDSLMDYAEKVSGWEAVPPPLDTACRKTNKPREAVLSGEH
jgi:hypothetical protein